MGERKEGHTGRSFGERCLRIGEAWMHINRKIESQNPTSQILIKSITVRCELGSESQFATRYFIIVRASQGATDLVKFRRLASLENVGHVVLDMLRRESDWRQDKFGSDGNSLIER